MKFAVTGWYGHGNIGDELLMCAVSKAVRDRFQGARVTVLSQDPASAHAATGCPSTIPLVPYSNLNSPRGVLLRLSHFFRGGKEWRDMLHGLEMLVVGGGSLLNDRQPGNLEMWRRMVNFYKAAGAKVYFYGISIGPIRDRKSLALVRDILLLADGNTLRDQPSVDLMRDFLPPERLTQSADPVLSLFAPQRKHIDEWPPKKPWRIGFNVRRFSSIPDEESDAAGVTLAAALLENFDADLWFLPMSVNDSAIVERIRQGLPSRLQGRFHAHAHEPRRLETHLGFYPELDLIVTMRLHTAVLSALHNLPIVGLDCNKKIPGFLGEIGLGEFLVEVSDGIHGCIPKQDEVLDQLHRLIQCWPSLQQPALERLAELSRRERLNMMGLQQALGTGDSRC